MNNERDFDPLDGIGIYNPVNMIDTIPLDKQKIHIRIQQRNGRKSITTIEGLSNDLKLATVLQQMKRLFHCNGAIAEKNTIMLFGDQRLPVKKFLIDNNIAKESEIVMHGY